MEGPSEACLTDNDLVVWNAQSGDLGECGCDLGKVDMTAHTLSGGAVGDVGIVMIPLAMQVVGHEDDEVDGIYNGREGEVVQERGMSWDGERQSSVRASETAFQE